MFDVPLFGLITLPALAPIIALLNLLFPGLLRDQWQHYRIVIGVMLTQTTVLFVHWVLTAWVFDEPKWWLSNQILAAALAAIAGVGLAIALFERWQARRALPAVAPAGRPVQIEWIALGLFALFGLAWAGYLKLGGGSPLDQMAPLTAGCLLGLGHLGYRRARAGRGGESWITTELVLLVAVVGCGAALGLYLRDAPQENLHAAAVEGQWPTYRGDLRRTGAASADDAGPTQPARLWTFDPAPNVGEVMIHSTPTVIDGLVYVGALYDVLGTTQGYLYCVNAQEGRRNGDAALPAGALLWRYADPDGMRPVFSSPTVVDGRVYFGEGYHQNRRCRLFCLDARSGESPFWTHKTGSHVESSPTFANGRLYFGAGDDGLICLQPPVAGESAPTQVWRAEGVHVDSGPLVADGRVIAGGVVGDVVAELALIAVDVADGKELWRLPTELPVPGSPAYADGQAYVSLGNGKLDHAAEAPAGAVWRVDAARGARIWEFPLSDAVMGAPALHGEHVVFGCRDGHCYCVAQHDGSLQWKRPLGEPIVCAPVVAGGKVYLVTVGGSVCCLNAADGAVLWRFDELRTPKNDAYSSPTLAGGRLYVAVGGKLHCLGTQAQP